MRKGLRWLAVLAVGALILGPTTASAQPQSKTYNDAHYSTDYPVSPTRAQSQHKIWFHANAWWALMVESTGRTERVFELMPDHTWRPTGAVLTTDSGQVGDAVQDGEAVHVVYRLGDGSLYYVQLTFDPAAGEYHTGTAHRITGRGAVSPPTIVRDSIGTIYVAWATLVNVVVTHSIDGGASWNRLLVIAASGDGKTQQAAQLVAYDNRVGLLWSNPAAHAFGFASHLSGDYPGIWTSETVLSGAALADNQISLVRLRQPGQPSDTLVAAVKTSTGDGTQPPDSPLIQVLVRAPSGQWSAVPAGTVGDGLDDAVLQVDQATQTLHLFATGNGSIIVKDAPWADIRFAPGVGSVFANGINAKLIDPTVTADPVDAQSGLVVLAGDMTTKAYRHAEAPISAPTPAPAAPDTTPPSPPTNVQVQAVSPETAVVSWSPATDGTRWVPNADGVPVTRYVVLRNRTEVATVGTTSFQDQARTSGAAQHPTSVEYQVVAVDEAGNRSAPVRVVAQLPGIASGDTLTLVGLGLLVLAGLAGGYGLWRTWSGHRIAARDELSQSHPDPDASLPEAAPGAPRSSEDLSPHR